MAEESAESVEQPSMAHQIQFLGFCVGEEEYGVDILSVEEIRSWEPVSRIPKAPPHEIGVINLRGSIVPIIDLRKKFALSRADYTPTTVVIVLKVGHRIMGIVVDSVSGVIEVDERSIQTSQAFSEKLRAEYVSGLISVNNRMVVLLDIDSLLALDFGYGQTEGKPEISVESGAGEKTCSTKQWSITHEN